MTAVSSFGSMKLEVAVKYNTTRLLAGTAENKNGAVVGDVSKVSSNQFPAWCAILKVCIVTLLFHSVC